MNGFKKAAHGAINGTSLQGYVDAKYEDLMRVFGPPHTNGDGYKVDAEWCLVLESGKVATIYNYKDGHNYNQGGGLTIELITDWHIGGTTEAVVEEVRAIIINALVS
jgi:hypothetical protein